MYAQDALKTMEYSSPQDITSTMNSLKANRMASALYEVFKEMKEKRKSDNPLKNDTSSATPLESKLSTLDNILQTESVTGPPIDFHDTSSAGGFDEHAEYKNKLAQIRTIYHQEIDKYEQACSEFTGHALKVLSRQSTIRPINQTEIDGQVARIEGEFSKVEHLLKKDTCASVMRLRNEFLDARPRKRNFSRQATEKLNTYFYSNTQRQYPSEDAKLELAKSCNISVSQVSNWFGNKRIRNKKNEIKARNEAKFYGAKSLSGAPDDALCTTSMRHIISQAAGGYNPQEMYQLMAKQRRTDEEGRYISSSPGEYVEPADLTSKKEVIQ